MYITVGLDLLVNHSLYVLERIVMDISKDLSPFYIAKLFSFLFLGNVELRIK